MVENESSNTARKLLAIEGALCYDRDVLRGQLQELEVKLQATREERVGLLKKLTEEDPEFKLDLSS